ncbi:hypothetical protein AC1031_004393 [Aphanomyces cochlioides]|nr:hypothetical protein AC1031_004393 [Aphanomyces cochlioides]
MTPVIHFATLAMDGASVLTLFDAFRALRDVFAASMHLQAVVYVLLGAGLMSVYVYCVTSFDRMMRRKHLASQLKSYAQMLKEERRHRLKNLKRLEPIPEHDSVCLTMPPRS